MRDEKSREMRRVFSAIHSARGWGDCESSSGPGSTRERAGSFLPDLIALVQSLRITTLLDAPCGDFNWARPLADAVDHYIGIDVVPALVDERCHHTGGIYDDKRLGVWRFADLPRLEG